MKCADDATVVGLVSGGGNQSAYREEVERLSTWCRTNNLLLISSETKELITDCRRKKTEIPPLIISRDCVERAAGEESLSWKVKTSELLKKAQQRLPENTQEE